MKIIVAMDSFKGSLSSEEANTAVEKGIISVFEDAEVCSFPMADGGEGRLDAQTSMGKVPAGLAKAAKKYDVPVIAFGGSLTDDAYELTGGDLDAIFSIQHTPMSLVEAMDSDVTRFNLEKTVSQVMTVININIS